LRGEATVNLYLVRHGEAKSKQHDPERALTDSGVKTARRMATFLRENEVVSVAAVRHSTKLRARQTAAILAEDAGLEAPTGEVPNLEPLDDVSGLAEELLGVTSDLMLVGHLPHLNRLASLLVAGDADLGAFAFPECGILCLRRGDGGEGGAGWTVRWLLVPALISS
jgi:phosphohistidine phosphatase